MSCFKCFFQTRFQYLWKCNFILKQSSVLIWFLTALQDAVLNNLQARINQILWGCAAKRATCYMHLRLYLWTFHHVKWTLCLWIVSVHTHGCTHFMCLHTQSTAQVWFEAVLTRCHDDCVSDILPEPPGVWWWWWLWPPPPAIPLSKAWPHLLKLISLVLYT